MPFYRVVFANNIIVSCEEEKNLVPYNQEVYYEQDKGKLIFAYIKSDTFIGAVQMATELVEKVVQENRLDK